MQFVVPDPRNKREGGPRVRYWTGPNRMLENPEDRHSGARQRREPGIQMHNLTACFWIPGPALRAVPE
jgi:hypothetical protein